MQPSYASGASDAPLIGQTIGDNLEATVERWPDGEALVARHQDVRLTWSRAERADRPRRARPDRERSRAAATASASGARTGRVGADPVRDGEGGRGARQPEPGLPHLRARVRAQPVRVPLDRRRAVVQDLGLRRDDRGGAPERRDTRARRAVRVARVGRAAGGRRRRGPPPGCPSGWPALDPDDAINIQYTSGTTGNPKGATLTHHNILNNGFFVGELCGYTEARPGLHPRALLPLLRDGDGQPRLLDPRCLHGAARGRVRAARGARGGRGRGAARASTGCPRCSSRSSSIRTSATST